MSSPGQCGSWERTHVHRSVLASVTIAVLGGSLLLLRMNPFVAGGRPQLGSTLTGSRFTSAHRSAPAQRTPVYPGVSVEIVDGGDNRMGAIAGVPWPVTVVLTATVEAGSTGVEMRVAGGCPANFEARGVHWKVFQNTTVITESFPSGWHRYFVTAQIRTAQGGESAYACDDVDVEGMPQPSSPAPTTATARPSATRPAPTAPPTVTPAGLLLPIAGR